MSATVPPFVPNAARPTRAAAHEGPVTAPRWVFVKKSVLPGFGISLGFTLLYLSFIVLIPLAAMGVKASGLTWAEFVKATFSARAIATYKLSFGASLLAAAINAVFGLITAWVLVRYQFPGKRVVDAMVDLPFALPTAVAGIALAAIYAPNGWIGELVAPMGVKIAYTSWGVVIALTFIGLPFVVRTVQPVLQDLSREVEEAAASLGATRWQTFRRVIFPAIAPSLLTGYALAFARGLGEYGSVIFIAGNKQMESEITPLLIISKLEQYDYAGAAAIGVVMLIAAFVILLGINLLQRWARTRGGAS